MKLEHSIGDFDEMWSGELPIPINTFNCDIDEEIKLNVCQFDVSLED